MAAASTPAIQCPAPATLVEPRGYTAGQRFAYSAALFVMALVVGLLLSSFGPPWTQSLLGAFDLTTPAALSALFAATVASMLFHELGHLLAATALNYQILGISLGPVRLRWLHGKYAVRCSRRRILQGSVAVLPRDLQHWRVRALCIAAAGPLATLFVAIAACVLAVSSPSGGILHVFWAALAQVNLFLFVFGLVPNGSRAAVRNDAALFGMLLQNGPEAEEWELVHRIGQLKLLALRPSDYPAWLMDRLATLRFCRSDAAVLAARTLSDWALDSGDVPAADSWDRQAVLQAAHCEPRLRNATLAASACFDVLFRRDHQTARAKIAQVDLNELFPPCFAHRVRAARLLAIGLPHLAPAQIIRAQYSLPMALAYYDFERSLLEKLHLRTLSPRPTHPISRYHSIEGPAVTTCQLPRSGL